MIQTDIFKHLYKEGDSMSYNKDTKPKILLSEYQEFTPKTFIVKEYSISSQIAYLYSGLAAEAGEVIGNYAKFVRGDFDETELRNRTYKELGDVMYFVSQIANTFNISIEDVLVENKFKLSERMKANKIKGDGENLGDR
jgi:NTP pyrophosphatase (non-canonical NTP hydrolase)